MPARPGGRGLCVSGAGEIIGMSTEPSTSCAVAQPAIGDSRGEADRAVSA